MVAPPQKCPKTLEIFFGGSWGIETATCTWLVFTLNFGIFRNRLVSTQLTAVPQYKMYCNSPPITQWAAIGSTRVTNRSMNYIFWLHQWILFRNKNNKYQGNAGKWMENVYDYLRSEHKLVLTKCMCPIYLICFIWVFSTRRRSKIAFPALQKRHGKIKRMENIMNLDRYISNK